MYLLFTFTVAVSCPVTPSRPQGGLSLMGQLESAVHGIVLYACSWIRPASTLQWYDLHGPLQNIRCASPHAAVLLSRAVLCGRRVPTSPLGAAEPWWLALAHPRPLARSETQWWPHRCVVHKQYGDSIPCNHTLRRLTRKPWQSYGAMAAQRLWGCGVQAALCTSVSLVSGKSEAQWLQLHMWGGW
jgi:hypothetical protein